MLWKAQYLYDFLIFINETTDIGKIIEPLKNNKGCINFFPEGSVVDDAAEAVSKTVSGSNSINKPLSDMSDSELASLGYKRYSDGSIRDFKGHFAGNSGTIPGTPEVDDW